MNRVRVSPLIAAAAAALALAACGRDQSAVGNLASATPAPPAVAPTSAPQPVLATIAPTLAPMPTAQPQPPPAPDIAPLPIATADGAQMMLNVEPWPADRRGCTQNALSVWECVP